MPRLIPSKSIDPNSAVMTAGNSGYQFSATRPDKLGATEYTLVTIVLDYTGSTYLFATELEKMLKAVLEACKKSPRANNLLVRALIFSSNFRGGTSELHGFKPLADIDPNVYTLPDPSGATPLYDAAFDSAVATNAYAKQLSDQDFLVNAIQVLVTDGEENSSATPLSKVKNVLHQGVKAEYLESNIAILVELNAQYNQGELNAFYQGSGFTHQLSVDKATSGKIAKLASFISQSVSSQSQSLGTGGPSQSIQAVI